MNPNAPIMAFMLLGSVGGLEQDTMGFAQCFLFSSIALLLMIWSMPKLVVQSRKGESWD